MFISVSNENDRKHLFQKLQEIKHTIKTDNINQKLGNFEKLQQSTRNLKPLIDAQKETTQKLNQLVKLEPANKIPLESKTKDLNFRIQDGKYFYADTPLDIKSDAISVNGKTFPKTDGLYDLLSLKDPKTFSHTDSENYKKILKATSWPFKSNGHLKSLSKNSKIQKILIQRELIDEIRHEREQGHGISIPNNKYDSIKRLGLLCSEYYAGNKLTFDEIMRLLAELKSKSIITQEDYNELHKNLLTHT